MIIISSKQRKLGLFLSVALGLTLAISFLPGIHALFSQFLEFQLIDKLANSQLIEMAFFVLVSLLFYLSVPSQARNTETGTESLSALFPSISFPLVIAFIFGLFIKQDVLSSSPNRTQDLFWVIVCIPLGEELLFRGWLWAIFRALFKSSFFTLTNPLPSALVFSSVSFSLWHLQNFNHISFPFLLFQMVYTFFTGIWLGYLRWKTGQISSSLLAHSLINLAASLPSLL